MVAATGTRFLLPLSLTLVLALPASADDAK
jgi:hypothetical protein